MKYPTFMKRWESAKPSPDADETGNAPAGKEYAPPASSQNRVADMARVQAIAQDYGTVVNGPNGLANGFLAETPMQAVYFGNYKAAASLHLQSSDVAQQRPIDLPPFIRMIEGIHNVYRYALPKQLAVRLDVEELQPETRSLIDRLHKHILLHQEMFKKRVQSPVFDAMALDLCNAVLDCELAHPEKSLPVLAGGKKISIPNADRLGIFLYGLELSQYTLLDKAKLPPVVSEFFQEQIGVAQQIPENIKTRFQSIPLLQAQREAAFADCLPKIQTLLRSGGHSLQMANLIAVEAEDFKHAAASLLAQVDFPPYPKSLKTRMECALVLESLAERNPAQEKALMALVRKCFDLDKGKNVPASRGDGSLLRHLESRDSISLIQASLCRNFLVARGVMADDGSSRRR